LPFEQLTAVRDLGVADRSDAPQKVSRFRVHVAIDNAQVFAVDHGQDLADGGFADAGLANQQKRLVELVGHAS